MSLPDCPYLTMEPADWTCGAVDWQHAYALAAANATSNEMAAGMLCGCSCCEMLLQMELCPEGWR